MSDIERAIEIERRFNNVEYNLEKIGDAVNALEGVVKGLADMTGVQIMDGPYLAEVTEEEGFEAGTDGHLGFAAPNKEEEDD